MRGLILLLIALPELAAGQDRVREAYHRLDAADSLRRAGRLGTAWAGYLDLLREFPTWWLPTLRAACLARDLHMPVEESRARAERAATLSPDGSLVRLARDIMDLEDTGALPSTNGYAENDVNLDRVILARARALFASGRLEEAAAEYRSLLERRPGCPVATWGLARALRALGRDEEADRWAREGATRSLFPARWRARPPVAPTPSREGRANSY